MSRRREHGFSLIEVMLIITVLAGLMAAIYAYAPQFFHLGSRVGQDNLLREADRQIAGFAVRHGRLPYADANGDGLEDVGVARGGVPYKTLGLGGADFGPGRASVRYGVYRNAGANADLAVLRDRFDPVDASGTKVPLGNSNTLDLCVALENGRTAAFSNAFVYVKENGVARNVAYALAAAGESDADGVNGLFDGLNGQPGAGFESPDREPSASYDDQVLARDFASLEETASCDTVRRALNGLADAKAATDSVASLASDNAQSASLGVKLGAIATAMAAIDTAMSVKQVAAVAGTLATAISELVIAIASCVASLGLACGAVAAPAAAVGFATSALASASVALGLNIGVVVTSGIAVAQYAAVSARANAAASTAGGGNNNLSKSIQQLQNALTQANTDVTKAQTDLTAKQNAATAAANAFASGDRTLRANVLTQFKTMAPSLGGNTAQQQTAWVNSRMQAFNASMDAAIQAQVTQFNSQKALQAAQQAEKAAKQAVDSKQQSLNLLLQQQSCIASGKFFVFFDKATKGALCRAKTANDPAQPPVSAADVAAARQDLTKAQSGYANAVANRLSAQSSFNQAKANAAAAAATAKADSCAAAGLILCIAYNPSVQSVLDAKQKALLKQDQVAAAQLQLDKATQRRAEIQSSLAQLNCMQGGGVYDSTVNPPVCRPGQTVPGGSPTTLFSGANAVLKGADAEGVAR